MTDTKHLYQTKLVELLTEQEAGTLIDLAPSTLQKYRITGQGPKFIKVGRKVRYRPEHLIEWLESRTVDSTGTSQK